mgnify:CR=1 FL=1
MAGGETREWTWGVLGEFQSWLMTKLGTEPFDGAKEDDIWSFKQLGSVIMTKLHFHTRNDIGKMYFNLAIQLGISDHYNQHFLSGLQGWSWLIRRLRWLLLKSSHTFVKIFSYQEGFIRSRKPCFELARCYEKIAMVYFGRFEWEPLFDTIDEIMTDYVLHYAPFVDYLSLYIGDKINSLGFEMHLKLDGHTTMIWIYIPYLICYMIQTIFVRQDVMPLVVSTTQHLNLRYNYNTNSMAMFVVQLVNLYPWRIIGWSLNTLFMYLP